MNSVQKRLINDLTELIVSIFNIQIPINNIDEVVKNLGGIVKQEENFMREVEGSVQKVDEGFIIFVSPYQSEERRKFTIAHELGHLFLHMGYKINQSLWDSQKSTTYYRAGDSKVEYQANEFAAALLMPKDKYKEIMDKNTDFTTNTVNTSEIAKYFGVSISAASNRGKFLGYLKW